MTLRALPPAGVPMTTGDLYAGLAAVRRGDAVLANFREDLRRTFGVRHVFLVSSGRAALSMLLRGFHVLYPDRNVVALPAFTSFSVPSAVVNAGLQVVLYDVDPATLSPVPESLARAVGNRTLAVVVCHLHGYLADLDDVRQITAPCGVPVIDDAAQSMGAEFRGRPAGTCGDAGLFSLSRGKNINAIDGGIIITDRDELAEILERVPVADQAEGTLRLFLKALILSALLRPSLYWFPRSLPFLKLGASVYNPVFTRSSFRPFQAAIARRMLVRLPEITSARQASARMLQEILASREGFTVPLPVAGTDPVYLRYPLLFDESVTVREFPEMGIVRSYPEPLSMIRELQPQLVNGADRFPGAQRLAARLVTLPTHQFVTCHDRVRIGEVFQKIP